MARKDGTASRSGPSIPAEQRRRPMVTMTLSPEDVARLDALAASRGGISRSRLVADLAREEEKRVARRA